MKTNFLFKICSIMIMMMIVCTTFFNIYSIGVDKSRFETDKYENQGGDTKVEEEVRNRANTIVVVTKYVCVTIAVIILLVISMRYMISAPAERADIKKHAVPFVIGTIILFGSAGVLQIIQQISTVFKQ